MREEKSKYVLRHNTEATWRLYNPILLSGEIGISEYTHEDNTVESLFKIGDGVTPWNDLPFTQPKTDTTLTLPYVAADAAAVGTRINYLASEIATLKATCVEITSFTIAPKYTEAGTTLGRIVLSWTYDNYSSIASQTINNVTISPEIRSLTVEGEFTQNTTFNLIVTDGAGNVKTAQVKLEVLMPVFYGVSEIPTTYDEGFVYGLTKVLPTQSEFEFSTSSSALEYIYFCAPDSFGTCTFFHRGFEGGVQLVDSITLHLNETYTETYNIYRSDYPGLGNTRLRVTFSSGPQTDLTISQTLPPGGTDGQVLMKASNQDFDTYWANIQKELPNGGDIDQVLTKRSSANGDVEWRSFSASLPTVSNRDNGKLLRVVNGYWQKSDETNELPLVYPEDNGKIMGVVNGQWVAKEDQNNNTLVRITYNSTTFDAAAALLSTIVGKPQTVIFELTANAAHVFPVVEVSYTSSLITLVYWNNKELYSVTIEKNLLGETVYTINALGGIVEVPDTSSEKIYAWNGSAIEWQNKPIGLPSVDSSDNGKVTQVVNGAWTKETPAWSKTFTGNGAPATIPGEVQGDFYLDLLTNQLYQRLASSWVAVCVHEDLVPEPTVADNGKVPTVVDGEYALAQPIVYENVEGAGAPTASTLASMGQIYIDTESGEAYYCTNYIDPQSIESLEDLGFTYDSVLVFPPSEPQSYPSTIFNYDMAFTYSYETLDGNNDPITVTRDGLGMKGVIDQITIQVEVEEGVYEDETIDVYKLIYIYDDNDTPTEEIIYNTANRYDVNELPDWNYELARVVSFGNSGTDMENTDFISFLLDNGNFAGYGTSWLRLSTFNRLPAVTIADDGKIPIVDNGEWTLVLLSSLLGGN